MISLRGTISSLPQRVIADRLYKPGAKKGVMFIYGDTGTRDSWVNLDAAFWPTGDLHPTTEARFPMGTIDTGTLWGNSTMRTNMSQLMTNQQTAGVGAQFASGKVHLIGVSAGGTSVLNWAKNNPTLVQSIILLIPCVDIQAIQAANRSGFKAELDAAYGGTVPNADNPASYASTLNGLFPIRSYYSTTDTVSTNTEQSNFATAAGAELISMGAVGHNWGSPFTGAAAAAWFASKD